MGSIEIVLGKSRVLILFLWIVYGGASLILMWIPIPLFFKILGIALLCCQGWLTLNHHAKRVSKNAIVRIWQDSEGRWGCQTRKGHLARAKVKTDSFKSQWLLILRLRLQARSVSVIVPFDAVNSSEYRALCTRFMVLK